MFYSAELSIRRSLRRLDDTRLAANGYGAEGPGCRRGDAGSAHELAVTAGDEPTTSPKPVRRGYLGRLAAPFEF